MTIRNPKFLLGAALALLFSLPSAAAERVADYDTAMSTAGPDGVMVFCYAADWNERSLRMLKSFWQRPELEAAAGDAKLVAVPFYQDPDKRPADNPQGSMKNPPFSVCPTVLMFDANGDMYANLPGKDYLGDEKGDLGIRNVAERLAALRKREALMKQAEGAEGAEKAKLISEACDLGISPPKDAVEMIAAADPKDASGCVRRQKFNARAFLYEQLETTDGFLAKDFVADLDKMRRDCMAIVNDEAYKTKDRQSAYNLLIGQSRRDFVSGQNLKVMIKKDGKIDEKTNFGQLLPFLIDAWGNATHHMSAEDRKKMREAKRASRESKKEKKESQRDKKARDKKAERNTSIE